MNGSCRCVPGWVLLVLAGIGCGAGGESVRKEEPVPTGALRPMAEDRANLPLGLEVEGALRPDGDLDLVVTVRVAGRLFAPPVLRVAPPEGASLVRGYAEEVLAAPGRDVTYRREFTVHPARTPLRIVVQSVGVAYGARAEASWPPPDAATTPAGPRTEAVPATGIGGVEIREAVPLDRPTSR